MYRQQISKKSPASIKKVVNPSIVQFSAQDNNPAIIYPVNPSVNQPYPSTSTIGSQTPIYPVIATNTPFPVMQLENRGHLQALPFQGTITNLYIGSKIAKVNSVRNGTEMSAPPVANETAKQITIPAVQIGENKKLPPTETAILNSQLEELYFAPIKIGNTGKQQNRLLNATSNYPSEIELVIPSGVITILSTRIEKVPVDPVFDLNSGERDGLPLCFLCQEDVVSHLHRPKCGHPICLVCLSALENPFCPVCKKKITIG